MQRYTEMISDICKGVYLFGDLSAEERAIGEIASRWRWRGSRFLAGEEATALYLIRKVWSARRCLRAASISASQRWVGSHFGEMAPTDGAKCPPAPKRSNHDDLSLRLRQNQSVLNGSLPSPAFYRALARFLSNRLRQTTTDMSFARKNLRHF